MKLLFSTLFSFAAAGLLAAAEAPGIKAPLSTNSLLILCDNGFEYLGGKAVYRGNVQVYQGDTTLNCELLALFFQTNLGKVDLIIAETNVMILQNDNAAFADRVVYTATNEVVTLTGNVLVDSPDGYSSGASMVYERRTGNIFWSGRVFMGEHPGAMRTNSSFIPIPGTSPSRSNSGTSGQRKAGSL